MQRFRLDPLLRDPRDVVRKGAAEVEVRQAAFWFFYWWTAWWTERELWVCDNGHWELSGMERRGWVNLEAGRFFGKWEDLSS